MKEHILPQLRKQRWPLLFVEAMSFFRAAAFEAPDSAKLFGFYARDQYLLFMITDNHP